MATSTCRRFVVAALALAALGGPARAEDGEGEELEWVGEATLGARLSS